MRSDENVIKLVIKLTLVSCGSSQCEFLKLCSASSRFEAYFVCHLALHVRIVKQVWPQHGNSQNLAAKEMRAVASSRKRCAMCLDLPFCI